MSKDNKHPQTLPQTELFDTEAFRVEAVLSKLPIHILNDEYTEPINIQKPGISWEVSPGRWGMPGSLAYKIDSIFINHRIDENRPMIPKVIKLGSLREILRELGMAENGTNTAAVKRALLQNATAFIQAKVPYRNKESVGTFEFGDTRYGIVLQNQTLPDGTKADAIYIVLHDLFLQFLRAAPVRPIRSAYLKYLSDSPFAHRLYEILSFQLYAAFKQGRPYATLRYSEYCQQAPLTQKSEKRLIYQQMWRIHKPHITSRYIRKVEYEAIGSTDLPDFNIKYYPGILARQEYELFNRKSLSAQESNDYNLSSSIVLAGRQQMPEAPTPAQELVTEFQMLRFGESQKRIAKSEEQLATSLIDQWGFDEAREMMTRAFKKATGAGFKSIYLTGLERYLKEEEKRAEKRADKKDQKQQERTKENERRHLELCAEYLLSVISKDELAQLEIEAGAALNERCQSDDDYRELIATAGKKQLKEMNRSFMIKCLAREIESGLRKMPSLPREWEDSL